MSKAIEGVALIGGAAVLGALSLGAGGVALAALANSALAVHAMEAFAIMGASMEAGAIASALTSNRSMNITTKQPASARQIVYGEQRIGGVIVYESTTGSAKSNYNLVIVLAGHEIDSITDMYVDGKQVHWTVGSTGNTTRNGVNFGGSCDANTYTGPNGVQYNLNGNAVYAEARYGDQVAGDVISGLTANDPVWAASAAGSPYLGGCAYVYVKLESNDSIWTNGVPEIRFNIRGKNNIFDPRTGTTGFTSNWALVAADVITDPVFGLGDNTVNQAQLIAAANICDEQVAVAAVSGIEARYTTNYHYDTGTTPGNALSAMMDGAAGRISRIGGEWWLFPAAWVGPSFSFDEGALTGTIQWEPYRSYADLINQVTGTYTAPNFPYSVAGNLYDSHGFFQGQIQDNFGQGWQATSFPYYAQDTLHGYPANQFQVDDGGAVLPKDISLPTVISVTQAQRIAKINLMRNRQQGTGTFPMSLAAWQMQPCDVMQFTFAENGWTGKNLEVVGVSFSVSDAEGDQSGAQSVRAQMNVQEADPSVYEWSTSEELTIYCQPAAAATAPVASGAVATTTPATSTTTT